jgi:hypothetical protein
MKKMLQCSCSSLQDVVQRFYRPSESANQRLRLALSKGPNRVGVSLPSLEDGNRYSLGHNVFYSYVDSQTLDKVQKPSDSECYTSSSEAFIFYLSPLLFNTVLDEIYVALLMSALHPKHFHCSIYQPHV